MELFMAEIPEVIFSGRVCIAKAWHSIEIESAVGFRMQLSGRRLGGGLGCAVEVSGATTRSFAVAVDAGGLSLLEKERVDLLRAWLPKRALSAAIEVLAGRVQLPNTQVLFVEPQAQLRDPLRVDEQLFRRRCRFDVLSDLYRLINKPPASEFHSFSEVRDSEGHTRFYEEDDLRQAIRYWSSKGYVEILTRDQRLRIDLNKDDEMQREMAEYSWDESSPTKTESPGKREGSRDTFDFDVFVCHASEDKKAVVIPLVEELKRKNLRVWVDFDELIIGDSLRRRIDDGLCRSRFGAVILSPSFFKKPWPQNELDGLVALENSTGAKRVLPVWFQMGKDEVAQFSPTLAGRLAARWSDGIASVVDAIVRACR